MTRRSLSKILSGEEQSLQDVWNWYEFQQALLGEEKSRVLDALAGIGNFSADRYLGKTREELENDFRYQTEELDRVTILGMLVATEAALRVDFIERVQNKRKDAVSREFWKIFKRKEIKGIRLGEDILRIWSDLGTKVEISRAVSNFKGVLKLRDWLAHGRWWTPKLGRADGYDPIGVFEICNQLLGAIA